ncbi:uncharacterized protein F54H12.2 [Trichonephila clavipes]|nr:uncharacterized protein F54H12.2 [Trichonephila clavipes]
MYKTEKELLEAFHFVTLTHLQNSHVAIGVPSHVKLILGQGLADLLGYSEKEMKSVSYIGKYPMQLNAGISEIFVYSDVVESHHVGDSFSPLLRIIPCLNEKDEQIVKYYDKPLYFPIKKAFVETIEIDLRTSSGDNIIFTGGRTLLFSSKSSQDSFLSSALLHKDTASGHDNGGATSTNEGFLTRKSICKTSKLIDLIGILHYDLAAQPKLLVNGVNVRIKLERQKDPFSLMASGDNYKICLKYACLSIRKINVAASVVLAQAKALELGLIKMPIRRAEVRSFALSSGLQSSTIANAFIGQLPTRLNLGFVSNEAYNGNFGKNPFNFQNYNLNYLSVLEGSKMIPSKPFQPNFANNLYARSYLSLFTDLNRFHNSQNINITYGEYSKGYTMYAIDLTPDMAGGETHMSINRTLLLILNLPFLCPSLIAYAEYRNTIEIDKARNVFTHF